MTAAASDGSDRPQRDERGHFLPGNRVGRGNPIARRQRELAEAIRGAVKAEDLHDVFASMATAARGGDVQAAQLLLAYAIGKPAPSTLVDLGDVPGLQTGEDVAAVATRVVAATVAGEVSVEAGEHLLRLLGAATDLLLVRQLEERLERLEAAA